MKRERKRERYGGGGVEERGKRVEKRERGLRERGREIEKKYPWSQQNFFLLCRYPSVSSLKIC